MEWNNNMFFELKQRAEHFLYCTCQEKVDSKKNIYQKPRSVLN